MIIDSSHKGRHINVNNTSAMSGTEYLVPTGQVIGDNFQALHYPGAVEENWSRDGGMHGGFWSFHTTDVLSRATKPSQVINALAETVNPFHFTSDDVKISAINLYLDGKW